MNIGLSESAWGPTENSKIRAKQAIKVQHLIDSTKYPVIFAGDFNDLPSSITFKILKKLE
jgi:endonuclease/exonuclease/phosphatase (EEP) superfamily protein YafD